MVFLYEYIWIDAEGNLRGKTKVTSKDLSDDVSSLPIWNYDGSSTKQAEGKSSEVLIKPQAIFKDPFHNTESGSSVEGSFLVMCDTYLPNMQPHPTNSRFPAAETFAKYASLESKFGIEQEFFIKHRDLDGERVGRVLGFGESNVSELKPAPQGQYYCSVGANNAFGREFIMTAFHNCLKAGLKLTGMNAEVAPGQWEFQVCADGIDAADQLYVMRYILGRTGESFGYAVDFHPKPIDSVEWNGSGCHTNFSTKPMREEGGFEVIKESLERLSKYQDLCMQNYGVDNNMRMTGELETSNFSEFSWGVANRGCSVRVPNSTVKDGKGYFEDRRPASNMDPYIVTAMLLELTSKENEQSSINLVRSDAISLSESSEEVAALTEESSSSEEEVAPVSEEVASNEAVEDSDEKLTTHLPKSEFSETSMNETMNDTKPECNGETCMFNCENSESKPCVDPFNTTIKKSENISSLFETDNTNPFGVTLTPPNKDDSELVTKEEEETKEEETKEEETSTEKPKSSFTAYTDYFNIINKKN